MSSTDLPFRRYQKPLPIPRLDQLGHALAVAAALATAAAMGLWTAHVAATARQFVDGVSEALYREALYWVGQGPPPGPSWGPTRDGACWLFSWTHHPPGATYLTALFVRLGRPLVAAQVDTLAAATTVVLAALAWRAPGASLVVALTILALLTWAPGYYRFMALPYEDTWMVTCLLLLAAAALTKHPTWPLALATAVTAATCIASVNWHAAIVGGVLIARHGLGRTTLKAGAVAIAVYVVVFTAHLLQVWCHFGWCLETAWADYVTGTTATGNATSLALRLQWLMPWAERWAVATWALPAYLRELVAGQHGEWADGLLWPALMGAAALIVPTVRGCAGLLVFLTLAASGFVLFPGLWPPHLHSLPRDLLLFPLGGLIVLGAGRAAA